LVRAIQGEFEKGHGNPWFLFIRWYSDPT